MNEILSNESSESILSLKEFIKQFESHTQSKYDYWAKVASIKYPLQVPLSIMYCIMNNLMELVFNQCICESREYVFRWLSFIVFLFLPIVLYVFYEYPSKIQIMIMNENEQTTTVKMKYIGKKVIEMIVLFVQ